VELHYLPQQTDMFLSTFGRAGAAHYTSIGAKRWPSNDDILSIYLILFFTKSLKYIPTIGGGAVPEGGKKKPFEHLKGCLDLLSSKQKMVI